MEKFNFLLKLAFVGTEFHGWQYQPPPLKTVQGELIKALRILFKKDWIKIIGCSRTDAGVHAEEFYANFLIDKFIEPSKLLKALNGLLPPSIAVYEVRTVDINFNSRYNATGKVYKYLIWNHPVRNPFLLNRAWHIYQPLDLDLIKEGAQIFIGSHDFSAFSKNEEGKNPIITIENLEISIEDKILIFRIKASHFLRYMVRKIIATLIELGKRNITLEEVKSMLLSRDPSKVPFKAPPYGLYLEKVFLNIR
jgi:tRNA pseudouridine38-40 synthase